MSREGIILTTLVVYKVVLLGLGVWGQRRTRNAADFYLGGRRLGPFVAALSASASSSSAWTILGVSGFAYQFGLSAVWLFPSCVGGFLINWCILAPGLRRLTGRSGALTVTEVLAGDRQGPLRTAIVGVASFIILISLGLYVCYQLQAAGLTFHTTFGLGLNESILVGAAIVTVYTLLGGFWAVSLTDALQGTLMALTSLLLPLAALIAAGGPAALVNNLATTTDPVAASLTKGLPLVAGIGFILGLLGIGLGYPGQPHVVNRMMALKDDGPSLRRARMMAITWAVIVYAGMLILGFSCRVLYPGIANNEALFIHATQELFPPVVAGIMLASVLSAIMSTADSQLLVAASTITQDLGWGRGREGSYLLRSRIAVLGLSMAATLAAITTDESIFRGVLFAWGAMGAAFGPLLLVTVLKRPVSPGRTLLSMILGCSLSVTAYYGAPDDSLRFLERVVPFAVALAVALWPSRRS